MDKKLYALAILDKPSQQTIKSYYALLTNRGYVGRQTKDIPYHFTLGETDTANEITLLSKATAICAKTPPIAFRMDHVSLFGQHCLFLSPNMNFELLKLQNLFSPGCRHGCSPWTAHATVLLDAPEAVLSAVPILTESFKPFEAKITAVAIYEFFPTRHIGTYYLKGTA